jgi:xanthine phosphoribosyltransferase
MRVMYNGSSSGVEMSPVNALELRILVEGRNLGRGILKVDSFVNHQVDPLLIRECAQELAQRFRPDQPTKVLTAEISGIAPALLTALELGVPVVYARKHKPITMPDTVFLTTAPSHTKGNYVDLMVSPEYLGATERVVIIDDFLASGQTILGLIRLAQAAGAHVIGVGALIEKTFEGGRELLEAVGMKVESLARITSMTDDRIVFAE